MPRNPFDRLSRRERQILDILLEHGEATAEEVRVRLPDPPSYSAARAMLAKLETKGVIRHTERDLRYVYAPRISKSAARGSAVRRLVQVFFGGSLGQAVTGMIDQSEGSLSDEELVEIERRVAAERRRRREGDAS